MSYQGIDLSVYTFTKTELMRALLWHNTYVTLQSISFNLFMVSYKRLTLPQLEQLFYYTHASVTDIETRQVCNRFFNLK